jgi:hypothetical protein
LTYLLFNEKSLSKEAPKKPQRSPKEAPKKPQRSPKEAPKKPQRSPDKHLNSKSGSPNILELVWKTDKLRQEAFI